ncbi:MAG: cupin domain-containing protein [Desulfomonile tiedjei]|nr:cupin domain-containing protein [Desulfomonile tiedjei]
MKKIDWNSIKEERLNENITRKMFWGEKLMVTRWELAPATTLPVHDHVSEQITMVEKGTVTIYFPGEEEFALHQGDMLVIPSSKPHGVKVGPQGATAVDLFSPLRQDFIDGSATYIKPLGEQGQDPQSPAAEDRDPYQQLQGYLAAAGIKVPLEDLKELPLDLLARYVYERQCITMGQLRKVLKKSKEEAKALLREWKHGDDHSESSLRRTMERIIVLPKDLKFFRQD